MGTLSDYCENKLLDHVFKTTDWPASPDTFLALGTAGDDTGITEPGSGNYAREQILPAGWNTASARTITNNGAVTFNTASGSWGTINRWAVYDAISGGNMLAWGTINPSRAIESGNTPVIADADISISFNAHVSNVGVGTALTNSLLDHVFRGAEYAAPANLYIGFGTTPLADADTITGEASGGGYARDIHNVWNTAAAGAISNSGAITFVVSGDWTASLDVVFISDSLTGTANANLLFFGVITSMSPLNGDTVEILDTQLDITLD